MASVSYGLNRNATDQPDSITVGTVAASGNDIVLSIDLTKSITTNDAIRALQAFIRRLEDGRLASADLLNI
jgi:hypothetical protein